MTRIAAGANTLSAAAPGGSWRIEKTGGAEDSFDAAAASIRPIAGDFAMRVIDLAAPNSAIAGVSPNPHSDDGYGGIAFAMWMVGADLYLFENGVVVPPAHVQTGTAWIVRSGSLLTYRIGATLAGASIVRTVTGVTGPLWCDCTIRKLGGAIGVRFEPPGAWCGLPRRARGRLRMTTGLQSGATT